MELREMINFIRSRQSTIAKIRNRARKIHDSITRSSMEFSNLITANAIAPTIALLAIVIKSLWVNDTITKEVWLFVLCVLRNFAIFF